MSSIQSVIRVGIINLSPFVHSQNVKKERQSKAIIVLFYIFREKETYKNVAHTSGQVIDTSEKNNAAKLVSD